MISRSGKARPASTSDNVELASTAEAVLAALARTRDWSTVTEICFRDELDRREVVSALRQLAVKGRVSRDVYQDESARFVERWRARA